MFLEARGLAKRFPGVRALDGVSLAVARGECVAVIGENGAGKSTLMKILAGVQTPDAGEILVEGKRVDIPDVRAAEALGIALIHQELNLCDNLDVASNLFLGREPRRGIFLDGPRQRREAVALLDRVGLDVAPDAPLDALSIGRRQMVEIAKALSRNVRLLIMDEPTSSLSRRETERLFDLIRELKAGGVSVVYISHRLGEVKAVADRVVALRDGRNSGELPKEKIEHDAMIRLMVGRELTRLFPHEPKPPGPPALEVLELRTPAHPRRPLSFTLRAGEIVGLAGLVGAGRSELMTTLFGLTPAVGGAPLVRRPQEAIRAGIGFVPEDRKAQGLFLDMTLRENLSVAWIRGPFIDREGERRMSEDAIARLRVKTPHDRQLAGFLSGGNQQKIVLGKWLALNPKVLLLDEPTRGVDVGAKQEIYRLMDELAGKGVAILFASSDLEEILGMSDRVLVMHQGRLAGELPRETLSEEAVMRLATGAAA